MILPGPGWGVGTLSTVGGDVVEDKTRARWVGGREELMVNVDVLTGFA
jgi:hypothetical protein